MPYEGDGKGFRCNTKEDLKEFSDWIVEQEKKEKEARIKEAKISARHGHRILIVSIAYISILAILYFKFGLTVGDIGDIVIYLHLISVYVLIYASKTMEGFKPHIIFIILINISPSNIYGAGYCICKLLQNKLKKRRILKDGKGEY